MVDMTTLLLAEYAAGGCSALSGTSVVAQPLPTMLTAARTHRLLVHPPCAVAVLVGASAQTVGVPPHSTSRLMCIGPKCNTQVAPTINSQERCLSLHLVLLFSSRTLVSLLSRPWIAKNVKGPWQLPIPAPRLLASAIEQHRRMFRPTVPCCAGPAGRMRHMRAFSTRGKSMKLSRNNLHHKEGISSPRRAP